MSNVLQQLPFFAPASDLTENTHEITFRGAERFPAALDELGDLYLERPPLLKITDFPTDVVVSEILRERFTHYGSDKSTTHSYHIVYGGILADLGASRELNILEIGIGTNSPAIDSSMGPDGTPGASLRAFRDVAPNAQVFGADIDEHILIDEPRIRTSWVNQMEPETFTTMHHSFGVPGYDLIIDDGLHQVSANLNTLLFGLSVVRCPGWIVIEDIWNGKAAWNTVCRLLPDSKYNKLLIECPEGCLVFAAQKIRP